MSNISIIRTSIPEGQRMDFVAEIFGSNFPMKLEPFVYFMADTICEDYRGGYWEFYSLSNGGFYMVPCTDNIFHVSCENGFEGELSADAFGIVCCLYSYSHLSFGNPSAFTETCARQFHLLREYMLEHPDAAVILRAID